MSGRDEKWIVNNQEQTHCSQEPLRDARLYLNVLGLGFSDKCLQGESPKAAGVAGLQAPSSVLPAACCPPSPGKWAQHPPAPLPCMGPCARGCQHFPGQHRPTLNHPVCSYRKQFAELPGKAATVPRFPQNQRAASSAPAAWSASGGASFWFSGHPAWGSWARRAPGP